MTIELSAIELRGLHGVLEHERREGQRFLVDLELDLADTTVATTSGSTTRARTTSSRRSRARSRTPS